MQTQPWPHEVFNFTHSYCNVNQYIISYFIIVWLLYAEPVQFLCNEISNLCNSKCNCLHTKNVFSCSVILPLYQLFYSLNFTFGNISNVYSSVLPVVFQWMDSTKQPNKLMASAEPIRSFGVITCVPLEATSHPKLLRLVVLLVGCPLASAKVAKLSVN